LGEKSGNHVKKLLKNPRLEMFKTVLISFIHPDHKQYLLAREIDWVSLEKEFVALYGDTGRQIHIPPENFERTEFIWINYLQNEDINNRKLDFTVYLRRILVISEDELSILLHNSS